MIDTPQNRIELVAPAADSLGGHFTHSWMSSAEYDLICIAEVADNVDAAAFSIGIAAMGAVRALKTTPLLTMADGVEAMRRAGRLNYAPPTKTPVGVG